MHIRQYFSHSTTYSPVSQHSTTLKWNLSSFNTYNGPRNSRNRKPCTGDEAQGAAQAAAYIRRAPTAAFRTRRATRALRAGSQGGGSRIAALSSRQGAPGAGLGRERRLGRGVSTISRTHLSAFLPACPRSRWLRISFLQDNLSCADPMVRGDSPPRCVGRGAG